MSYSDDITDKFYDGKYWQQPRSFFSVPRREVQYCDKSRKKEEKTSIFIWVPLTYFSFKKFSFAYVKYYLSKFPVFRGVNAIVYMVDAADPEKIEASRNELHNLLEKPQLAGIPVLVLGNKRDLPEALDENGLIEKMNLNAIQDREICCYSISCKEKDNIDITLQWLISHSKGSGSGGS